MTRQQPHTATSSTPTIQEDIMPICSACYPDRPCTCIRPTTGGVGGGPGSSSRLIQALRTAAEIAGRRARGGDESGIAVYRARRGGHQ